MGYSYKTYSDTKEVMKKYVNAAEGEAVYESFYLLTLAAVAKELKRRGLWEARVFLAVGLPLTRFGSEKADFMKYLTAEKDVEFLYENVKYHILIESAAVFPQCYAAVADKLQTFNKKTLIVDIGSWTIDIMPVVDKVPDESKCVTIPKGLITCMRTINEQCVRQLNGELDESFMDTTTWRSVVRNYADDMSNVTIIELDCSHYLHHYESERISEEIDSFLQGN